MANASTSRGTRAIELYQAFRGAEKEVNEKILLLENHWTRLRIQLEFLRKISHIFDEQHAQVQQRLLHTLEEKLLAATSKVEVASAQTSGLRRLGYLFLRQSMEKLMIDLDNWQKVFDPTWFLMIRISDPLIDSRIQELKSLQALSADTTSDSPVDTLLWLRRIQRGNAAADTQDSQTENHLSIHLPKSGLEGATEAPIQFSESRVLYRPRPLKPLIIETIKAPETPEGVSAFKTNVKSLARQLKQLGFGTCGLLQCYGIVKRSSSNKRLIAIDVLFRTPDWCREAPRTLRQSLLDRPGEPPSLTQVVNLAKQVARAVSFFHTCDFVHKSVRPENVLVFSGEGRQGADNRGVDSAFLVGYEDLRNAFFQTNLRGDGDWHRNLYRHPQRQGVIVEQRYSMQHDIYSLGVCLLEMGLWQSFVLYGDNGERPALAEGLGLVCPNRGNQVHSAEIAMLNKDGLVNLARTRLAPRTGDIYATVVLACLTCLDPGNEAFGDEEDLKDEDGVLVGVRFIEQILMKLEKIAV